MEDGRAFKLLVDAVDEFALFMLDPDGRVLTWNRGAERLKGWAADEIIGQPITRFYPREDVEGGKPHRELEHAASTGRVEDVGWRVRKDGTRFWAHVVITAIRGDDGRLLGYAKLTRDLTEQAVIEQNAVDARHAQASAEEVARRLGAFQAVAEAASRASGPDDFIRDLLDRLRGLLRVDTATVLLREEPGDELRVVAASGLEQEVATRVPVGRGFAGRIAKSGEALVIPDVTRPEVEIASRTLRSNVRSVAGVPLIGEGGVIGVLHVGMRVARDFGQADLQLLQLVADRAASAIERSRAREALERSEARFRATFDYAGIGMAQVSRDGRWLRVNRRLCEILGAPEDRLVGGAVEASAHPQDWPRFEASATCVLGRTCPSASHEMRLTAAGGRTVWAEVTVAVVLDAAGRPDHLSVSVQDVTARTAAESAARESNARSEAILSSITDAFVAFDSEWRFVYANAAAERLLGSPRAELLGRTYWDVHPSAVGTSLDQQFRAAVAKSQAVHFEGYYPPLGMWMEAHAYPSNGGLSVYLRDITQRKRAEAELRRERDFVSLLLDTVDALVVVLDAQGRIVRFNRACERTTGWSFEEVVGRDLIALLLPPDQREPIQGTFTDIVERGLGAKKENEWLTRDGRRRMIAWSNTVLRAERGEVEYVIGTGIDVTEARRAERDREVLMQWHAKARARAELLASTSAALHGAERPEAAISEAVDAAARELGAARGALLVFEPGGALRPVAGGPGPLEDAARWGTIRRVVESREPVKVAAAEAPAGERAWLESQGCSSCLMIPSLLGRRLVAIQMAGFRRADDEPDAEALEFATSIARQCAIAIDRSRLLQELGALYGRAEERAAEMEAVFAAMADPVVVFAQDGRIRQANPAALAAFGSTPLGLDGSELIARLRIRRNDGRLLEAAELPSGKAWAGQVVIGERFVITGAEARDMTVLISSAPLRAGEQVVGVVSVWRDITQLELLHAEIETQRRLFADVFREAPVGIAVFGCEELRVRWANRLYCRFLDCPEPALIEGEPLGSVVQGAGEAGIEAVFRRVAQTGQPYFDPEFRYDGRRRTPAWWRWSITRLQRVDGGADLLVTVADVTEQVLARRRIEEEHKRLETILQTLPVGVILADRDGVLVEANEMASRIWGGSVHERSSPSTYRGWHAETGAPLSSDDWAANRVRRTGRASIGEVIDIERLDGTRGTIINNAAPLHDSAGNVTGAVVAIQDITESRRLERERQVLSEQVERQAAQLDAVIESMADPVLVFGPDGSVARMNAAARELRLFGGPAAGPGADPTAARLLDPEGRPFPPGELATARALFGEAVRGQLARISVPDAGGGERKLYLSVSAAPIRGPTGEPTGAVATFSDVTYLHDLKEQRETLVRMLSHDLRTPLSTVLLHAQMLKRDPSDAAKVIRRAEAITTSTTRMNVMIQDLVDMARLETGQMRLERRPIDLRRFIAELVERLAGTLEVGRVHLAIGPRVPSAYADPSRLERIVVNLLSNALKYSPPDAQVEIAAGAVGVGGVEIAVMDRGPGIAREDIPRLFERYYRTPGTATRKEGLGLGLYITSLLVRAHEGAIRVDSEPGQGSTFRVLLPTAASAVHDGAGAGA